MVAPVIVQKKPARLTSAGTSLTLQLDTTPVAGRLIVVFAWASGGHPTIADDRDGGTNTYTLVTGQGFDAIWGRCWRANNIGLAAGAGNLTLTLTPSSGSQILSMWAAEIGNYDNADTVDTADDHWETGPGTSYSPLVLAASEAVDQLILAATAVQTGFTRTIGADTGWTLEDQYNAGSSSLCSGVISRTVTPASGTYDPAFTLSSGGALEYATMGLQIRGGTDGPTEGPPPADPVMGRRIFILP